MHLSVWLTLLQLVGLAALVVGIALWSVPAALVVGGLVVIVTAELADRRLQVRATVRLRAAGQPPGDRL